MSVGHGGDKDRPSEAELDDCLAEALANPKVRQRLARSYKLVKDYDIPLLGSYSVGGHNIYIDRHFKTDGKFGYLRVGKKLLNAIPGLIRHERLEEALMEVYGWKYLLAHYVAEHWEEQLYRARGFDPIAVEKAYEPFIKADETKKLTKTPTDLDRRPLMSNSEPEDKEILKHEKESANRARVSHASVGYVAKSVKAGQECSKCAMWKAPRFGGSSCVLVKDPISPGGYCRRFVRGTLGA